MMSFKVKGCWARTRIFGGVVVAKTCESRRRRRFNVGNAFFSSDEKTKQSADFFSKADAFLSKVFTWGDDRHVG